MDLKSLAELNRVVIIDNNDEEGTAISRALNEKGVSSHFHHFKDLGSLAKIADLNFPNVRLVFLDLELYALSDDNQKANLALEALGKLVTKGSHYILVVWSGVLQTELKDKFLELLKDRGKDFYPSIEPITINKKECRNKDKNQTFSSYKINRFLVTGLKQANMFNLFADWEKEINRVTSTFLRDFLDTEDIDELSGKINSLADAYAGQYAKLNPSKNALLALNSALKGTIDSAVVNLDYSDSDKQIKKDIIITDEKDKARINSVLMLNLDLQAGPGCAYKVDKTYVQRIMKEVKNRHSCTDGCTCNVDSLFVKIDITPLCDFAQENKTSFYHFIYAALIPREFANKRVRDNPGLYELRSFFNLDDADMEVVIDLSAYESAPVADWNPEGETLVTKFRDSIVIDFQQRVAAHHSRPGHALLSTQ
jgi:hypothetical protein